MKTIELLGSYTLQSAILKELFPRHILLWSSSSMLDNLSMIFANKCFLIFKAVLQVLVKLVTFASFYISIKFCPDDAIILCFLCFIATYETITRWRDLTARIFSEIQNFLKILCMRIGQWFHFSPPWPIKWQKNLRYKTTATVILYKVQIIFKSLVHFVICTMKRTETNLGLITHHEFLTIIKWGNSTLE